jgi:hypothetical protein
LGTLSYFFGSIRSDKYSPVIQPGEAYAKSIHDSELIQSLEGLTLSSVSREPNRLFILQPTQNSGTYGRVLSLCGFLEDSKKPVKVPEVLLDFGKKALHTKDSEIIKTRDIIRKLFLMKTYRGKNSQKGLVSRLSLARQNEIYDWEDQLFSYVNFFNCYFPELDPISYAQVNANQEESIEWGENPCELYLTDTQIYQLNTLPFLFQELKANDSIWPKISYSRKAITQSIQEDTLNPLFDSSDDMEKNRVRQKTYERNLRIQEVLTNRNNEGLVLDLRIFQLARTVIHDLNHSGILSPENLVKRDQVITIPDQSSNLPCATKRVLQLTPLQYVSLTESHLFQPREINWEVIR